MATAPQPTDTPPIAADFAQPAPAAVDQADELLLLAHRRRISVELYHKMAEAGILTPEDRVELIEGVLVTKMTKDPPHIIPTDLLQITLSARIGPGYFLSMGNPVAIPERDGEPEPDTQVVRGHPRDYLGRHYGPADVGFVVEVADSSYAFDRRIKWKTYAAGGVAAYWIVDLTRRVLEVHGDPAPEGYRTLRTLGADDECPIVLDGREVGRFVVRDILP